MIVYVVIEYYAAYETDVIYAGLDSGVAERIYNEDKVNRSVDKWENGTKEKWLG